MTSSCFQVTATIAYNGIEDEPDNTAASFVSHSDASWFT
jgi:hypothetical protein